ncbi:MmcQ/YjbR family DNA-binding protein [Thermomonospora umbrina]|uniref:Putative DNA-binding protein (MmcQ/YjbR family) n=1 Tax=Thermomonospora umbrina TaxID=111806 RepID=A0A3D9SY11_9ACTN|nr:MmcQ/YjbR family DNA-binding protein [Thermomonospora umbrina]REE97885.1 putative DNA-binding protein (MmcQ/YjbR family) [Thermomonospora umbrina]
MTITGSRLQRVARDAAGALPGVSSGRPFTDKLDVYKVGEKVFLIVTDDPDERIITVKSEPDHGRSLQREHESITPGRYLNKAHWISVAAGREITEGMVEDLVAHSYELVRDSLPRGRRPAGHGSGSRSGKR